MRATSRRCCSSPRSGVGAGGVWTTSGAPPDAALLAVTLPGGSLDTATESWMPGSQKAGKWRAQRCQSGRKAARGKGEGEGDDAGVPEGAPLLLLQKQTITRRDRTGRGESLGSHSIPPPQALNPTSPSSHRGRVRAWVGHQWRTAKRMELNELYGVTQSNELYGVTQQRMGSHGRGWKYTAADGCGWNDMPHKDVGASTGCAMGEPALSSPVQP